MLTRTQRRWAISGGAGSVKPDTPWASAGTTLSDPHQRQPDGEASNGAAAGPEPHDSATVQ